MGLLGRNELLEKEVLEIRRVNLGNGKYVFVRQMTGTERDVFEDLILEGRFDDSGTLIPGKRGENYRAKLLVSTICDEKGNLILQPGDYVAFGKSISAKNAEKLVNVSHKLNLITEEDKKNLEKNSEGDPTEGSTSDLVKS